MRPRRLRVKGYTAFVEEAEVDFDGLDLFAITGPTGAGKTSLLQAMTIALYGRAPKLGDDLRQLISPSVERAQFFFEFSAHSRCYRITRVMFRGRPTAVALEAQSDDGEWQTLTRGVREANARVEQILGLDFDSFTKVVLLPQNEFDAFLRGKPEERRSILTRLLSLEIYGRIQQRANQVASEARTQAELLTGLLERDYADATPKHLDEVKEAGEAALGSVKTVSARLEAIERAMAAASGVRQRRLAHRTASGEFAALEHTLSAAREEHETSAGALARIDRDVRIIADRLAAIAYDADRHLLLARAAERTTRLREVVAALVRLDGDDAAGRAQVEELAHKRGVLGQAAAKAERALALSEEAEQQARSDLQEQQRRFGTRATIAGLVERERRYRVDREQEKDIEQAVQTLVAHGAELATTRAGFTVRHETEQAHLEEARSAAAEQQRNFEADRAMQSQATALGDRLTPARDRAARAQAATEQARDDAVRRRHIRADAEEACHAAQESARGAEDNLGHLERAHAAHALRSTLAVGQPCPVCATRVRRLPTIEPVDDLEHARRAQEEARRQLTDAQGNAQRATADVAVSESALRASTAALAELSSELDHLAAELRAALPPDLHEDSHWAEILQKRIDAAATSRAASDREVETAQQRVAELASALARIDGELRTVPAQIDERRRAAAAIRDGCEETERLLTALLGRPPGPNAASELAAMDARLGGAEEALASAVATTQEARDTLRKAQGEAERAAAEVEAEADRARARGEQRSRLTHERGEIQRTLQAIVPDRLDVVDAIAIELEALIAARSQRDTTSRELADCQQERARMDRRAAELSARLSALDRQLDEHRERERVASEAMNVALTDLAVRLVAAGITLDGHGDEHDELAEVARRTKDERDAVVRRAAELGAQEQALAEKIGRATQCREQRDAARMRMEVSRELGQLLGANNLQTHVLTDAMRVLVEDGSLHLQRLSDGRYRLSAQDLDFHVVDAWNGDAVRSVKTLSGGETFLTSLALALALAERLADLAAGAHGHEALESLFVDEGFGALDTEETLETVVQAIEALQAHDRLVGIVTHLTPLAERMPAQIKVRKAPEGSRIEMVK